VAPIERVHFILGAESGT